MRKTAAALKGSRKFTGSTLPVLLELSDGQLVQCMSVQEAERKGRATGKHYEIITASPDGVYRGEWAAF